MSALARRYRKAAAALGSFLVVATIIAVVGPSTVAGATHFRASTLTWTKGSTGNSANFQLTSSFRRDYPWYGYLGGGGSTLPVVGSVLSNTGYDLTFGDGAQAPITFTVTSIDAPNDVLTATATFSHTYTGGNGPYTAGFENCCRLATLAYGANDNWNITTTVSFNHGVTGSPTSSLPPIVYCAAKSTCNFDVPATDPDGLPLTYALATSTQMYAASGIATAPPGATVNATTGEYSLNTTGLVAGDMYPSQVVLSDGPTGYVSTGVADFIIQILSTTATPPAFVSPTPSDGSVLNAQVNQPFSLTVAADTTNSTDPQQQALDPVTLKILNAPTGSTFTTTPAADATGTFAWTPTVGAPSLPINVVAEDANGYVSSRSFTIDVALAAPALTWAQPAAIVYGTPLGSTQLDASAAPGVTGTWSYTLADGITNASGAVLDAGSSQTLVANFTPTGSSAASYGPGTISTTIDVTPAQQDISFPAIPLQTYRNPPVPLQATSSSTAVPITYSTNPGDDCTADNTTHLLTINGVGPCTVTANQAASKDYYAASPVPQSVTIAKATPQITWNPLSPITFGTPLSADQLDAQLPAGVTGTITYTLGDGTTPALGYVLHAGDGQTLIASYTPDPASAEDYNPTTTHVAIDVLQAPQTVTLSTPGTATYGDPAFDVTTTGGGSQQTVTVTATGGGCTVAGDTVTILHATSSTYSCVLTANQAGTADYLQAAPVTETVGVAPLQPTLSWPTPSHITYGTAIEDDGADATLTATVAPNLPGSITYAFDNGGGAADGAVVNAGSYPIDATFTPDSSVAGDVLPAVVQRTVIVDPVVPTITWAAPADITYGTPLGSDQLDASVSNSAPGTISYFLADGATLASGYVLSAGDSQLLIAKFTPDATMGGNYLPAQGSTYINVDKAGQAVSFVTGSTTHSYGDAPFDVIAQGGASGNPVLITPVPGSTCTTVENTDGVSAQVTITGAGDCNLQASQAGNTNYLDSNTATESFSVRKELPDVNWTNPADITYGTPLGSAQLNASMIPSAATGPIAYTLDGGAPASGAVLDAGTHNITATYTPDAVSSANFDPASAQATLTVDKANQTIDFAPFAQVVYSPNSTVNLQAGGGASANQVVFSAPGSDPCSIVGSVLTVTGAGTCHVTATQAGNNDYNDAQPVEQDLIITAAPQTIGFARPPGATYGDGPIQLTAAEGGSGQPVLFSDTRMGDPCTVTPAGVVTINGAGSCLINADETGDTNYLPATEAQQTLQIAQAGQTITFDPIPDQTYGNPAVTLNASGGPSENPVTFAWSGPCSLSGLTLSFTGAGTCTVDADQQGDINYTAAAEVEQQIVIAKATPQIAWTSPSAIVYGTPLGTGQLDPVVTPTALAGTMTYNPPSGTVLGAGNGQKLAATFTPADTADYNQASVSVTIDVNKAPQAIEFAPQPSNLTYGAPPFQVQATGGGSTNPVLYSLDTNSTGCDLAGATVTITAVGNCVVDANQSGDGNYLDAPQAAQSFTVSALTPTVNFPQPAAITYGTPLQGALAASVDPSNAPGSITYSGPNGPVDGNTVLHAGTDQPLTASFTPSSPNYTGASASTTITVNKAEQQLTFAAPTPVTYTPGLTVPLSSTPGASSQPVSFTLSQPSDCSLQGSTLTVLGAGSCTVTANEAGNGDYNPSPQVAQTLQIGKASTAVTFSPLPGHQYGDPASPLTATGDGASTPVVFTAGPGNVCATSGTNGSTLNINGVGQCTVTANQAGDSNYNAAAAAQQSFAVSPADSTVTMQPVTTTPLFGHPDRFTVSISSLAGHTGTPTGTVTVMDGSNAVGTVTLIQGSGIYTTGTWQPGVHSVWAAYSGDTNFLSGQSGQTAVTVGFSSTCLTTVHHGPLQIADGESYCIGNGGTQQGPLSVASGGALAVLPGGSVTGPLASSGATALTSCGSTITGPVSITGSTGLVTIGSPAGCSGNRITGPLTVASNQGGMSIAGNLITGPVSVTGNTGTGGLAGTPPEFPVTANTITGPLACSSNSPGVTDLQTQNAVSGPRSGQCSATNF